MLSLIQDLRFALRTLRTNRGFTVAAVATLSLGIAANTTIFSVANGVLLRSLPYRDADRLVLLTTTDAVNRPFERPTSFPAAMDWHQQSHSFSAMSIFQDEPVVWMDDAGGESLTVEFAAPGLFAQLGVHPALGRSFTTAEAESGQRLVVLSHALWQRRFGGQPDAIGKSMQLNGKPAQIIGVLPAGFRPLTPNAQLWMPYSNSTYFESQRNERDSKFGWNVIATLRPGMRFEDAQTEMTAIAARLATAWPELRGKGVRSVSLHEQVTGGVRRAMQLLLAAVIAVLLIACTNLGSLVLARGAGRQREIAVRTALGAGRGRLVSQFLTESLTLAVIAGALGFGLAAAGLRAVLAFAPRNIPRLDEVSLDGRAVLFTLALSALSAILFGLAPALRLATTGLAAGSRAARGGRRMRDMLVVAEFALAMILLAGAGLLIRSMIGILGVDPGYRAASVLTVSLNPNTSDTPARFQQLVERLEATPGIEAAGGVSRYFQANLQRSGIVVERQPPLPDSLRDDVNFDVIGGNYLQALGVPLLRGRYFGPQDGPESPKVALVNDAFVRKYLAGADPVGQRFRRGNDNTWYTIAGVIGDMRRQMLTKAPIPEVVWPHAQRTWGMNLVVRTAGNPLALAGTVREIIRSADRSAVIMDISTLGRQLDERVSQQRFQTWMLGGFAAFALLLAAIGIYGLMHYAVTERTREIGIRIAIGAQPRAVFGMMLGHAARLAAIGIGVGTLGALWLTSALAAMLYGVSAHDPLTYVAVAILLGGIAAAASAMPAWRAMRCDPLIALRQE